MLKVRFSIRSILAAMFVMAVFAALVSGYPDLEDALQDLPWAVGTLCGILWTRGRGTRCLIFTSCGSAIGMTLWAVYAVWSPTTSFFNWFDPPLIVLASAALGLLLGVGVRVIMEGFRVRTVQN